MKIRKLSQLIIGLGLVSSLTVSCAWWTRDTTTHTKKATTKPTNTGGNTNNNTKPTNTGGNTNNNTKPHHKPVIPNQTQDIIVSKKPPLNFSGYNSYGTFVMPTIQNTTITTTAKRGHLSTGDKFTLTIRANSNYTVNGQKQIAFNYILGKQLMKKPIPPVVPINNVVDVTKLWLPIPTDTSNEIIGHASNGYPLYKNYPGSSRNRLDTKLVERMNTNGSDGWFSAQTSNLIGYTVEPKDKSPLYLRFIKNGDTKEFIYKTKPGYTFSDGTSSITKLITFSGLSIPTDWNPSIFPTDLNKARANKVIEILELEQNDPATNKTLIHIRLTKKGVKYLIGLRPAKPGETNNYIRKYDGKNPATNGGQDFWVEVKTKIINNSIHVTQFAGHTTFTAVPKKGWYFQSPYKFFTQWNTQSANAWVWPPNSI